MHNNQLLQIDFYGKWLDTEYHHFYTIIRINRLTIKNL